MNPEHFTLLADTARRRAGLVFTEDKTYLVKARVESLLRKRSMPVEDLISALRRGDEDMTSAVLDVLTNNETSFFRDKAPFRLLRDQVFPDLARRHKDGVIRMWSAGCSTGQEPYSLAMAADRWFLGSARSRVEILATDISQRCIDLAAQGRYSRFEVQRGVSAAELVEYFEADGTEWRAKRRLRDAVRWRRFNLLDHPKELGTFDVVFCRNVLIYFDPAVRRRILEQMAEVLMPEGYLFLGASETVLGITEAFAPAKGAPGVYRPNPASAGGRLAPLAKASLRASGLTEPISPASASRSRDWRK